MIQNNHMAVYEAVYLLNQLIDSNQSQYRIHDFNNVHLSVAKAMTRILVNEEIVSLGDDDLYHIDEENYISLLDIISRQDQLHLASAYEKAVHPGYFMFDVLDRQEDEIYARCNFPVTYHLGKKIRHYINVNQLKILEIGGNSGGLGTAFSTQNFKSYHVVDRRVPCKIGQEFEQIHHTQIKFIQGDMFDLHLNESYDLIVLMNILHDFDDETCTKLLEQCLPYTQGELLIIEDILDNEYEPKEAVIHGLRLSLSCHGGHQRTVIELNELMSKVNMKMNQIIRIDEVHQLIVYRYEV